MRKKIKIFGLSAAVLLILVTMGPCIVNAEEDEAMQKWLNLMDSYNQEFIDLEDCLMDFYNAKSTFEGFTFTSEQEHMLEEYYLEAENILQLYGIPQPPQPPEDPGINAVYSTRPDQIQIPVRNNVTSGVYYSTQFCLDHPLALFFLDLAVGGFTLAIWITVLIILLITNEVTSIWDFLEIFTESLIVLIWGATVIYLLNELILQYTHGAIIYAWPTLTCPQVARQPDAINDNATKIYYNWLLVAPFTMRPNPDYWTRIICQSVP